jgi:hypothetical protein
MFCTECGGRNADEANFCSQCGRPMSAPAPGPVATAKAPSRRAAPDRPPNLSRTLGLVAPDYRFTKIEDLETARSATMMGFLVALLIAGLGIKQYGAGRVSGMVLAVALAVPVALWFMSRLAALFGLVVGAYVTYLYFRGQPGTPILNGTLMILLPLIFLSAVRGTFAFHRLRDEAVARAAAAAKAEVR